MTPPTRPRTTLTGQTLPPALPATAKAWNAGLLDGEHLRTIQTFIKDLPDHVQPAAVEKAEAFLAEKAAELRPDQLAKLADRVAITLNPDGNFSDDDRALRRGFQWCGRQRPDGMSVGKLIATPELRATLDALLAKFAAPGMCNPDDHTPSSPANRPTTSPTRPPPPRPTPARRPLGAAVRSQLGDPTLGRHNGLPVTIIVSTTVEQLSTAAGLAVTGGGTLVPIRDVIRLATHGYHYLCVFDKHTERALYLGRTKRIAPPRTRRVVLHAKDRGCTAPGCNVPGYLSEVHHAEDWATGGHTDVDDLTLGCARPPTHQARRLAHPKTTDGSTEWIPPPHFPLPGGTNDYHHPERLL